MYDVKEVACFPVNCNRYYSYDILWPRSMRGGKKV